MWIKLFVSTILLLFIINCSTTYSIYKRNEYDYPRTFKYLYRDLLRDLQRLRELNDPLVNKYIDDIERAINLGDYNRLIDLLRELGNYLEYKGYSSEKYDYVSILIKLIEALERAGPYGLEINYEKLDPYLRSLIENAGLREFILTLDVSKLLSLLEKYGYMVPGISDYSSSGSNQDTSVFDKLPPSHKDNPLTNVFSGLPFSSIGFSITLTSTTVLLIIFSIITILVLLIVVFVKRRKGSVINTVSDMSRLFTRAINKIIPSFRNIIVDPVISLYNKWYGLTKRRGYRRCDYETLREYLLRIQERDLRSIGFKITSLYEDKVYGSREIDKDTLLSTETILNKLENREND